MIRLGVDLGGTKIEIVALDSDGRERLRRRIPTPQGDYPATVAAVATLVESAEAELGVMAPSWASAPPARYRRSPGGCATPTPPA